MRKIGTRFSIMFSIDFTNSLALWMCLSFFFAFLRQQFFCPSQCDRAYAVESHNAYLANTLFPPLFITKTLAIRAFFVPTGRRRGFSYFHCAFLSGGSVLYACILNISRPRARPHPFFPSPVNRRLHII